MKAKKKPAKKAAPPPPKKAPVPVRRTLAKPKPKGVVMEYTPPAPTPPKPQQPPPQPPEPKPQSGGENSKPKVNSAREARDKLEQEMKKRAAEIDPATGEKTNVAR